MPITPVLIILLTALTFGSSDYVDSDGYELIGEYNSLYKLHSENHFFKAVLKCLSEQAQMFYPTSMLEARTIYDRFVPKDVDSILIGVHKYNLSDFITIDGKSDFFTNLRISEPAYRGVFVILKSDMTMSGSSYLRERKFVCKKSLETCPLKIHYAKKIERFNAAYEYVHDMKFLENILYKCLSDGADIFYPLSFNESAAVFEDIIPNNTDSISIGIYNTLLNNTELMTIDGKTVFYSNWQPGLPNPLDWIVALDRSLLFRLDHVNPDNAICVQRDKPSVDVKCSFEITSRIRSRKYYFHSQLVTWDQALDICKKSNFELAMPENQLEVSLISDFFKDDCSNFRGTWLGFKASVSFGYIDVKGDTLKRGGFKWIQEESRCHKFGCGSVTQNGYLTTQQCSDRMPFVCQEF